MTADPRHDVLLGRVLAAACCGTAYRIARRRRPSPGPQPVRRRLAGAVVALGTPAATVAAAFASAPTPVRAQLPRTAHGKALLAAHVVAGVLAEETLWRGPIVLARRPALRGPVAVASAAAFLGLHLLRDGRGSLPAHLPTTVAWTAAALLDRRLRWSMIGHAGYNAVVLTARPEAPDARDAPNAPEQTTDDGRPS